MNFGVFNDWSVSPDGLLDGELLHSWIKLDHEAQILGCSSHQREHALIVSNGWVGPTAQFSVPICNELFVLSRVDGQDIAIRQIVIGIMSAHHHELFVSDSDNSWVCASRHNRGIEHPPADVFRTSILIEDIVIKHWRLFFFNTEVKHLDRSEQTACWVPTSDDIHLIG